VGLAIFGVRLGQACAQLTHAWVKFFRVAQRRFLTAPSVCHHPNCPLTLRVKQRMGWVVRGSDCTWAGLYVGRIVCGSDCTWVGLYVGRIVRGSDCHSQSFDPLLRGRIEWLGVVGLSDPCGVGLSQYENVCWANRYSVRWCGSVCHSVQLGGGAVVKAP
jgi:hypothetical protein